MKKIKNARICEDDMCVLLQAKCVECGEFFDELANETFDLHIYDYFNKYYEQLRVLLREMKTNYPEVDMSTRDIELLYKRSKLHKKK